MRLAPPPDGELTVSRMSSAHLQSPVGETSNCTITYTTVLFTKRPSTLEVNQGEPPTVYDHVIPRRSCEATNRELDGAADCTTSPTVTIERVSEHGGRSSESTAYTTVVFAKNTEQNPTTVSEPQETLTMYADVILPVKTVAEAEYTTSQSVMAGMTSDLADTSETSTVYTSIVFTEPITTTTSDVKDHTPCATKYEQVILPFNKPIKKSMQTVCNDQQQEISPVSDKETDIVNGTPSSSLATHESSPEQGYAGTGNTETGCHCILYTDLEVGKLVTSG